VRSGVNRTSIASAAFTRSADSVATVDTRGNVYAFHIRKNRYQLLSREGDEGTAVCCNEKEVFAGFVTGVIKVFDMDKQGDPVVATLKGHRSRVTHIELSANNDLMLSTSNDCALLWDLTSGTYTKKNLAGGAYGAVQARFAGAYGEKAVVAFHDESLWVWNTRTGVLETKCEAPDLGARSPLKGPTLCQSIAISKDSRYAVTAGGSPCLFVWDLVEGVIKHAVELPDGIKTTCDIEMMAPGTSEETSADSESSLFVAVACDDGSVRIVDPMRGAVTHTMVIDDESKEKMAEGLSVEPNGRYAAVLAAKGQMRLYDVHISRAQTQNDHPKKLSIISMDDPGALKNAVHPPAIPTSGSVPDPIEAPAGFGPPPSTKPRLGKGRRGPTPGTAKAPPASSSVAAGFDTPKALSAEFLDARRAATEDDVIKLKDLLAVYGEFPEKYRLLTWRKILRLPDNEKAYEALASKGIHPAMTDLPERFPISDRSLLLRLQRICSCLSHYSPVFAESPVVPGMVFPFVKAFKTNEVYAFESFLVLVNNHARGWFELFPDPPYGHLGEVEAVVRYHDPVVAKRMESVHGGVQGAAWQLLSTLFTDVTTADEWLRLFDHVVVGGREMLTHLAAAYVLIWRDAILNAPEGSTAIKQLFARDAGTSLERLLEKAYLLRESSPAGMTTLEPTKIVDVTTGVKPGGPRPDFQTIPGGSIVELPRAMTYPVFEGFPKRAVDYAAGERDRLRAEEDALLARQKTVKSLQKRTEEVQAMEMAWEAEAQRMAEIEEARKSEMEGLQSGIKAEMKRWEEKERLERLKQVEAIESAYASALSRKKAEWNAELLKLKKEVDEKRETHAEIMKRRGEDEQLSALEFQAQQRLWALEEERAHVSALERVRREVAVAEGVAAAEEKRREAEWRTQDDEAATRRAHEAARRVRLVAQTQEADSIANAKEMFLRASWEKEARTALVEKERRLRIAAETEAALSSSMVEAARVRDQTLAQAEINDLEKQAAAEKAAFEAASRLRKETVDSEWASAAKDAEDRAARMRDTERAGRRAALEAAAAERRRVLAAAASEEEAAVRKAAQLVEAQRRRDAELEAEMQARAEELAQRIAHAEQLASAENQTVQEERDKYRLLRERLALKALDHEGEARRRHDELMHQLVLEREKQLLEMDAAWRKNVAKNEMSALGEEAAAYKKAAEERETAYAWRESEQLEKIERLRVGVTGVIDAEPSVPETEMEPGSISGVARSGSEALTGSTEEDDAETRAPGDDDSPVSGASPEGSPPKTGEAVVEGFDGRGATRAAQEKGNTKKKKKDKRNE